MSKMKIVFIGLFIALTATLLVVTCGDDSSSSNSNPTFGPGTYTGILTITEHRYSPNEFTLVDTLMYIFYQGDSFRVDTLPGDPDPLFCPSKGKYSYTNDSLKVHNMATTRPEVCNHADTIDANFYFYGPDSKGWLIYKTSDTALYRQLELKTY
jgi:hypothetical protein